MPPWQAKVVAQQLFSHMPAGHRVNYLFQRHVTRGLPLPDQGLRRVADIAIQHVRGLAEHSAVPIDEGAFFEFGAGWDLHVAQLLYCLGVERQIVVDIRPLLRPELVFDIRDRLHDLTVPLVRRPPRGSSSLESYLRTIGVDYRAPLDARATGMPGGSIDFVTSTNTLEHIPRDDIASLLQEVRRLLSVGGAMSFQIDYKDHYSYFDSRLTAYNYLQYGDRRWRWCNPPLHFQNRLRHSDYLALFDEQGFRVVDAIVDAGTEQDRRDIDGLDLAANFRSYTLSDLAARKSVVVLEPASIE